MFVSWISYLYRLNCAFIYLVLQKATQTVSWKQVSTNSLPLPPFFP